MRTSMALTALTTATPKLAHPLCRPPLNHVCLFMTLGGSVDTLFAHLQNLPVLVGYFVAALLMICK